MCYGYCPFEICQDEHFGSGLLGLVLVVVLVVLLVVLVVVVVSWLCVAIELVVVVVSGVALFIYFKGVSSSVSSEIDTATSFYKNDLYRAKRLC